MTVGRCISTEKFSSTLLHNSCVLQFYTTVTVPVINLSKRKLSKMLCTRDALLQF